jgi:hypothetical protein
MAWLGQPVLVDELMTVRRGGVLEEQPFRPVAPVETVAAGAVDA